MSNLYRNNFITILGSGTSTGIPQIGCTCKTCRSTNTKNKRFRTSICLHSITGHTFLIDTSPDLRSQALINKINHIDAAIITHEHADHLHGIDDLRQYYYLSGKRKTSVYANQTTIECIKQRFSYIFKKYSKKTKLILNSSGGKPKINLKNIKFGNTRVISKTILKNKFKFFLLPHGITTSVGFYHEHFTYIPDCHNIPWEVINFLKGKKINLLIIDCLQLNSHSSHLTVDKTFEYIKQIAPKKAGLIHMNHSLEHTWLKNYAQKSIGQHVFPVYDGQKIPYN